MVKEAHFILIDGQRASIDTKMPVGIYRILINNNKGDTEIHVLGKSDFNLSSTPDFLNSDEPEVFVSNNYFKDLAFELFFSRYLKSLKPKDLEILHNDVELYALVEKEARKLWWEFDAKSQQRLNSTVSKPFKKRQSR